MVDQVVDEGDHTSARVDILCEVGTPSRGSSFVVSVTTAWAGCERDGRVAYVLDPLLRFWVLLLVESYYIYL